MQPVKNNHVYGWAALPNISCHGRARLAALKHLFVLMFSRLSTTLKQTAGRAPPNTVQLISRCWNIFSSGWYAAFQIHSTLWLGCAPPNTAQYFSRWTTFLLLNNLLVWMLCSQIKTFKVIVWPRSPTSPVTAQLIWRRWRIFSFWCYADFQQRLNERLVVLSPTRSSSFHVVEASFCLDNMKLFKNSQIYSLAVPPQTRPSSFFGFEEPFTFEAMQPLKTIHVYGWIALPYIFCHGSILFTAAKKLSYLMLCRQSTTFKWTVRCAPPNTVQLISSVQTSSRLDDMKLFKNIQSLWLGRASPNTAQFL